VSEKERKKLMQAITIYKKDVLSSKEKSLDFLVGAGVCTKSGALRTPPKR